MYLNLFNAMIRNSHNWQHCALEGVVSSFMTISVVHFFPKYSIEIIHFALYNKKEVRKEEVFHESIDITTSKRGPRQVLVLFSFGMQWKVMDEE